MTDQLANSNKPTRERAMPRPNRSEVADIWFQSGLSEGLSMEWVFDRYDHTIAETGREM